MKIEIEIPDEDIAETIKNKLAELIVSDRHCYDKNMYQREIAKAERVVNI